MRFIPLCRVTSGRQILKSSPKVDPSDRDVWRLYVRSAMHAASQLPVEGSTLMWMMLLHVNLNADDDERH